MLMKAPTSLAPSLLFPSCWGPPLLPSALCLLWPSCFWQDLLVPWSVLCHGRLSFWWTDRSQTSNFKAESDSFCICVSEIWVYQIVGQNFRPLKSKSSTTSKQHKTIPEGKDPCFLLVLFVWFLLGKKQNKFTAETSLISFGFWKRKKIAQEYSE